MIAYPDASFLISLYVKRPNSPSAVAHLATLKEPLPVGSLLRVEVTNAIRREAFRGVIPQQLALTALAAFDADREAGRIVIPSVPWERVHAEAERLSNAHTLRRGHRTFDILHVATALTLSAKQFLTFDATQAELARAERLKVKP